MTAATVDQETGRRITEDLDTNFLVEAGAGTGKTYALVSRVVALVRAGFEMKGIVAITFTEAAAAELSERVRTRLEQLLDDTHPDNAHDRLYPLTAEGRQRAEQALADLDQAALQTIHSFASQLLRDDPIATGLPPGWTPLDDMEADRHFADWWEDWLDHVLGRDTGVDPQLQATLRFLFQNGVQLDRIREIAGLFSRNSGRLRLPGSIPVIDLAAVVKSTVQDLEGLAAECIKNREEDTLWPQLRDGLKTVHAVRQVAHDPFAALETCRNGAKVDFSGRKGNSGNWARDCKEIRAAFRASGQCFQEAIHTALLTPLLHNLRRTFALDYEAARKADGVATFDDLLVWARDLLYCDADARRHFQARYTHILIDEFQDTDPLQAEIAFCLAARPDADIEHQAWHSLPLVPGKLFIVGDSKQSIYRFRRADIGVTRQVRKRGQLQVLQLTENRRSQQAVLDWVNAVFDGNREGLMHGDRPGQALYVPLQPNAATQREALGSVTVFGGPEESTSAAWRSLQARHTIRLIAAHAGETAARRLEIYDKTAKRLRPANLSDVCILIRSRTGLNTLEQALDEAGIPYRVEGRTLLFHTQEVQDLLNCLRAIDDPADDIAVVAALRSPAFACSDAELLRWKEARGRAREPWNCLDPDLQVTGPDPDTPGAADREKRRTCLQAITSVWQGLQQLRACHQRRHDIGVAVLIEQFVQERQLETLDLAEYRPRERWRRRRFLVEQARQLESMAGDTPLTLHRFLQWVESQRTEQTQVREATVTETDDDAVRIMTIHGAKGLEFPIVILLGLGVATRRTPAQVLSDQAGQQVEVSFAKGIATAGYDDLKQEELRHLDAEIIRLAYVGATRARDHLLVSLYHKTGQEITGQIQALRDSLPHDEGAEPDDLPAATGRFRTSGAPAPSLAPYDLEAWRHARRGMLRPRLAPLAVTATRLAQRGSVYLEEEDREEMQDTEPYAYRSQPGGTAFGSAVHAVLQDMMRLMVPATESLSADTDMAALVARHRVAIEQRSGQHAAAHGLWSRDQEIADMVARALRHEALAKALKAPRRWPEMSVAAPVDTGHGTVVIEGIIDLMYQEADGRLVLLDYKTNRVAADDIAGLMEHYRHQGAAYAYAVQKATGLTIRAVQFLFVRPRVLHELENLPVLMNEVPDRVAAAFLQPAPV